MAELKDLMLEESTAGPLAGGLFGKLAQYDTLTKLIEAGASITVGDPLTHNIDYPRAITSQSDAELFLSNPDQFFAKAHNVTLAEYLAFRNCGGMVRCGRRTRKGKPCMAIVGHNVDSLRVFMKITREERACKKHG